MEQRIFRRNGWLGGILSVGLCLALVFSVVGAAATGVALADKEDLIYPIMHPDRETREEWIEAYNTAPIAYIEMEEFQVPSLGGSLSLLDHLEYTPAQRNQGSCGNCWAWAGTGVMEIALDVQNGTKDRLSIQYLNSCEGAVIGKTCCAGGWLDDLADFYDSTEMAIPWSNSNAQWQDGDKSCDTACGSISTTPNYTITSIQDETVLTHSVGQSTAIANIKNVLNQNKAVWFGFLLANDSDWDNFLNFWGSQPESVIWNPDFSCGHTWVENEGAGHAVLCVGYNDEAGTANDYWIMLNSWGTTTGRPNGLFRLDMDMNYDCYFYDPHPVGYYSFYWETLGITYDVDPPSVTTSDASGITGNSATLNGSLDALGTAPTVNVSFEWGKTVSYGNTTTPESKNTTGAFTFALGSLSPNTTYHFKAEAIGDGTSYGSDKSFCTLSFPVHNINTGEDFSTIQAAIDAVNTTAGHTITVAPGTYNENVDVNKQLTIRSTSGNPADTTVNATDSNDHVFYVTADWVNITGFTVENATGGSRAGIYLGSGTAHCNISSNKATNNRYGIYLSSSSNNTLTSNTANSNSMYSIYLLGSSNNTLINNTASHNTGAYGIYLYSSNNNTLQNNDGEDNLIGIRLSDSGNNTLDNNTASSNNYGIWLCTSSSNNTLINNTANSNNDDGIHLDSSSNNTLDNNTANSNDGYGIYLDSSSGNTLRSNTVCDNDLNSIRLVSSSGNTIYNNYFNNTLTNAWDNGNNTWNTTNTTGPNIVGGPHIGGNYWSDYTTKYPNATEIGSSGFGDTPYDIIGGLNKDYLPLVLTGATLEGHVSFTGRGTAPCGTWIEPFTVKGFEAGNLTNVIWTGNATTNSTGVFTISGLTPGTYDIGIKNRTCLSEVNTSVTLTAGNTTVVDFGTTQEGDIDNSDWVYLGDLSAFCTAWDTKSGDGGWNADADLDRNDWVYLGDLSLFCCNWDQKGDAYGHF